MALQRCLVAALAVLVASLQAAAIDVCPNAEPYLTCVYNLDWKLPNLTAIILNKNKPAPLITPPPLTLINYAGKPNLLAILPLNAAVDLVGQSIPPRAHNCPVPIFRGPTVKRWAANPKAKYYSLFKPCANAPWPDAPENSFVMGSFGDLSKLTSKQLKSVPQLAYFKRQWGKAFPNLGMCMGTNPCGMNIFIGLENVNQWTSFEYNFGQGALKVVVAPEAFYYSWGVSVGPPAWQPSQPVAWGIDPQALGTLGYSAPVTQLSGTSVGGSVYVSGPLTGSMRSNQLATPLVVFEMGSQSSWWGMLRDNNKRATSMGLRLAPDVVLWNRIRLALRGPRVKYAQLTARTVDSFFWLTAPGQNIRTDLFVAANPSIGSLLNLLFTGAKTDKTHRISAVDVHGHGTGGVAIRLWFAAGKFTLTPAARLIVGTPRIWTDFGAILRVNNLAPNFQKTITVSLNNVAYQLIFCEFNVQCPSGCYSRCNTRLKICVPRSPAPAECPGNTPLPATL